MSVGRSFHDVREGAGMSTRDAADLLGLTESAYIALEADQRSCTHLEQCLVTQAFASLIDDSRRPPRPGDFRAAVPASTPGNRARGRHLAERP